MANNKTTHTKWQEHCLEAIKSFVINAVVIDNQPVIKNKEKIPDGELTPTDDGMGGLQSDTDKTESEIKDKTETEAKIDIEEHELDIRVISDTFSEKGISCAFVLPDDENHEEEKIINRSFLSAISADIVIIDWYLYKKNHELTKKIILKIAEDDATQNGRIRLICIYTGENQLQTVYEEAKEIFKEKNIFFNDSSINKTSDSNQIYSGHSDYYCLMAINKKDIPCQRLPEQILKEMSTFINGLLSTFSIAAVTAIRRNMHHIIARFAQKLDPAFVANYLITDPPTDVSELMCELFHSECEAALESENVMDKYLSKEIIKLWLEENKHPKTSGITYENLNKEQKEVDKNLIDKLLEHEIRNFDLPEKERDSISKYLNGGKKNAKKAEIELSKFITLKRDVFETTKNIPQNYTPVITLGTILYSEKEKKYYYCLMPICDTLRLYDKERKFLFLELKETGNINLLVSGIDGETKKLMIDAKPINICSFYFKGNATSGRVQAEKKADKFVFSLSNENSKDFIWIGEVRTNRANRDMAELLKNWLRLGINDSEYLRLVGKGCFSF